MSALAKVLSFAEGKAVRAMREILKRDQSVEALWKTNNPVIRTGKNTVWEMTRAQPNMTAIDLTMKKAKKPNWSDWAFSGAPSAKPALDKVEFASLLRDGTVRQSPFPARAPSTEAERLLARLKKNKIFFADGSDPL